MTLGFLWKSFPLAPRCAFLFLPVGSDSYVTARLLSGWIDFLDVTNSLTDTQVAKVEDGEDCLPENTLVGWWNGLTQASSQANVF